MNRLPGLDLLRAIAIIWVMLFHSFLVGGLGPHFSWLSRYGWVGVDIFFVLSGFLIGTQLLTPLQRGERLQFGRFYSRRAWRIVPAFAVTLALYVGVPSLREAPGLQPWWQFATFTMNLLIDYQHNQAFSHAWSLCVEEHFYLLFPPLAYLLSGRLTPRSCAAVAMALVIAGIALRGGTWLHDATLDTSRNWFIEDIYYPTWMRLDGLLVGVVLAALRVYRPATWALCLARADLCLMGGLLICAAALWLFEDRTGLLANTLGWPVLSSGLGLLLIAGASRHSLIGRRAVPGAGWIAGTSYSLYLIHKMAIHLVDQHLSHQVPDVGLLRFAAYTAAVLAAGATLHYVIEKPFLRFRSDAATV